MNKPSRYIPPLSTEEASALREIYRNHPSHRVRQRAHAILLSEKRFSLAQIATMMEVTRHTVGLWLDRYEQEGSDGLEDEDRPGRPRKMTSEDEALLRNIVQKFPQAAVCIIVNLLGTVLSPCTIRRALRSFGYVWKRHRRSLKGLRCPKEFARSKKELEVLKGQAAEGSIDLLYFDETGFSQQPNVPYGWQPSGSTEELPSTNGHSARTNVIGAVNYKTGELYATMFDGRVDATIVEYVLTELARSSCKETVIVLDNASFHTSEEMQEVLEQLEQRYPVTFYFLPPYSPELNLIEIVWKRIKYTALQIASYADFATLKEAIAHVLRNYHTSYWKVTFA